MSSKLKVTARIGEREYTVEYEGTLTTETRMQIIETVLGVKGNRLTDEDVYKMYNRAKRTLT